MKIILWLFEYNTFYRVFLRNYLESRRQWSEKHHKINSGILTGKNTKEHDIIMYLPFLYIMNNVHCTLYIAHFSGFEDLMKCKYYSGI